MVFQSLHFFHSPKNTTQIIISPSTKKLKEESMNNTNNTAKGFIVAENKEFEV